MRVVDVELIFCLPYKHIFETSICNFLAKMSAKTWLLAAAIWTRSIFLNGSDHLALYLGDLRRGSIFF